MKKIVDMHTRERRIRCKWQYYRSGEGHGKQDETKEGDNQEREDEGEKE